MYDLMEPRLKYPVFVTRIEPIPLLQIELYSAIEKCPVKKRDWFFAPLVFILKKCVTYFVQIGLNKI